MSRFKLFIPLIVFCFLAPVFYVLIGKDPKELPSALIGKPFPDFQLENLFADNNQNTDKDVFLSKTAIIGQPFLLNVWATWCAECRREHPVFLDLASRGVNIVGMNYKDDRDAAKTWLKELDNPYTHVIFDNEGLLGLDLGVYGAPETFVVNEQGVILYKHVGALTQKLWQEKLAPLYSGM